MSTISAAIYELFHTWKTPSEIFKLLKPCVNRSGVYKVLKHLRVTRSSLPMERRCQSKRKNTQSHQKDTRKIRTNPKRSIRKLASGVNVSYGFTQTAFKIDFNLSPFKNKAQVLSQTLRAKILNRAKRLLEKLKEGRQPLVMRTTFF